MTIIADNIVLNKERNVNLVTMLQNVDGEFGNITRRPAVLILPGGGYSMCSDREAEVVAYPYLQAGYHAFVLRYSVKEHRTWPNPLNDYEQAMELIRSKEEQWSILVDKIAVIGFSAGGHLAASAATMSQNRPNAAILGYAALEQDISQACQPGVDIPAPVDYVDGDTCPCFLFAARDDAVVPIRNTVNFQSRLAEFGIQFESHIYAYGGHGFSTGDPSIAGTAICRRAPSWVRDSIGWLEDVFGQLTNSGMGKPICPGKINGNGEHTLNVDCTYGYLEQQGQAKKALADVFAVIDSVINKRFGNNPLARDVLRQMKLRDMMIMLGQPGEAVEKLNITLNQIPNIR